MGLCAIYESYVNVYISFAIVLISGNRALRIIMRIDFGIPVLSILNDIKCIQLCMYNTLNRRENVCSCNIIRLFYSTLINQSHHQAYSQNNEKHSFQTNIPFRPFLFICLLLIHCMAFDYECIFTKRIQSLSLNRRATQKMMH